MVSGGGTSSSQSSQTNGFSQLPDDIKKSYSDLSSNVSSQLLNGNGTQAFTPLAQTADETAGYDVLRSNNPIANYQSNIDMQMNPYQSSVIDQVNRQAQGQYSAAGQAASQAGQFGSNRSILGANDIDQTRLNTIGSLLSNQFNTASQNALTTIPQDQTSYAQNLLGIGNAQRALSSSTSQAPVQALLAAAQAMGVLPKTEGTSVSSGNSNGFNFGVFSK